MAGETINIRLQRKLDLLNKKLEGELFYDQTSRLIYATDASAYREVPIAVVYPKNSDDIKKLVLFARDNKTSIIPRTAGTSLAGQVIGNGIIADVSKHMTQILELNEKEKWVRVEPGVILDELNKYLQPYGLYFGPETSTSNRCMMGGMVGNNACGAHSLVYGSTRDHTLELNTILSDGSEAIFRALDEKTFGELCKGDNLENKVYQKVNEILSKKDIQEIIRKEYPDAKLERRNTGYALDILLNSSPFTKTDVQFNYVNLLAGSEGTLAFTTEIKLNLVPLPPKNKALVCVHLDTIPDALRANLIALKFKPVAVELMDKVILDLTKENIEQEKNRFFVKSDPGAILIVEFAEEDPAQIEEKAMQMEAAMKKANYGFHFPVIRGADINKVWEMRKAGLGILNNMPGDAKPVPVIEDTAVLPEVLPDYIEEMEAMFRKYDKQCVYYAHIATGELHLRPILNLKDKGDVKLFHQIAEDTARIVKKHNGSLSGEHGDGRLRGEFIPLMMGEHIYNLFKELKETWDPDYIFNPGKIVDTPKMNTSLRYEPGKVTREIETWFDFSKDHGILRSTEKCNGTAACRKTEVTGGSMCPSYMASRDENKSTRARANVLREFLTNSDKTNPFDHKEIYNVMDMCLSCKACKSECPSSVDVAKLKAEFLQHYYESNGVPLRTRLIANISKISALGSLAPGLYNFFNRNSLTSALMAKFFGFAKQRSFPLLSKIPLEKWYKKNRGKFSENYFPNGKVYLFNDEFTRFNDTDIGIKAIRLLTKLGYEVIIPDHIESGRAYLSKGLLKKAKSIGNKNVDLLKSMINHESPLVGIEPSAILTFRDEYPELVDDELKPYARELSKHCLMIDEFLAMEMEDGKIKKESFSQDNKSIKLHGHCQQKALASTSPTMAILSYPENYSVEEIPSGCCGMAGSFGYEKEHYELSMKVGELVLFPAVRNFDEDIVIAAPGTSCRHQIKDGTHKAALHPIEILFDALIK
jgi:FAD/FMN-containing dehydrogenase/Fe-S oxidoreductase